MSLIINSVTVNIKTIKFSVVRCKWKLLLLHFSCSFETKKTVQDYRVLLGISQQLHTCMHGSVHT